jgi:hypothetical protein
VSAVRVVIEELAVHGWSRRRATRFGDALAAALPDALRAAGISGDTAPAGTVRDAVSITLDRRARRDPQQAAAVVATAIARAACEGGPRTPAP